MKRINIIFFVLFFILKSDINAQCLFEVGIEEKISSAEYLVEGQLIKKESFWLNNQIFTKNQIKVIASNSSNISNEIIILTKGGQVDDKLAVVQPSLILEIKDKGIFLLNSYSQQKDWFYPSLGSQSFVASEHYAQLPDLSFDLKLSQSIPEYKASALIEINNIEPLEVEAGNGQILKIFGSGFGADFTSPAKVQFRNPNYFAPTVSYQTADPSHIVYWSDTEIHVRVPSRDYATGKAGAGSGEIRVVNSTGEIVQSTQEISVLYNRVKHDGFNVDLINDNGSGGYTFQFSNNFSGNTKAVNAFNRAVEKWSCAIQTNLSIDDESTSISCAALDNVNVVSFDTDCSLPFGTLAETTNWFTFCSDGTTFIEEIDIVFANTVNWNFTKQNPGPFEKDFESIVIHELGHAHGIEHVLEREFTMYPSLADEKGKRKIDQSSKDCGQLIVTDSTDPINCGDASAFIPSDNDCEVRLNLKAYLQGTYIGDGWMRTSLVADNLLPSNQPFSEEPYNYAGTEFNSNLFSYIVDWVLVELRIGNLNNTSPSGTYVCERQAALIQADGKIVAIDGFSPLVFSNLMPSEEYYICLRHRNHLDVISSEKIPFSAEMTYDFTKNINSASGDEQLFMSNDGNALMYAGDISNDGVIQQTDFDIWKLNPAQNATYSSADCNLDGIIQITDFDLWYYNRSKLGVFEIRY